MAPSCNGNKLIFLIFLIFILISNFVFWYLNHVNCSSSTGRTNPNISQTSKKEKDNEEPWNVSFEGFNNVTGADRFIVPNIIHFIRFNQPEFLFVHYVVIKAAMRNHRPDYFYIHTNVPGPGNFTGRYWTLIQKDYELWSRIRLFHMDMPKHIFGHDLDSGHHASDIQRIRTLQRYGGIYLDNDEFVIQNLDKYRKFECTIEWRLDREELGNQVIIAHKNSRFLNLWLESYRFYNSSLWYYNAGEKPVPDILIPHPELIHRVNGRFNSDPGWAFKVYGKGYNWRRFDTTHLLYNWRTENKKEFNEKAIQTLDTGLGEMVRELLNGSPGTGKIFD